MYGIESTPLSVTKNRHNAVVGNGTWCVFVWRQKMWNDKKWNDKKKKDYRLYFLVDNMGWIHSLTIVLLLHSQLQLVDIDIDRECTVTSKPHILQFRSACPICVFIIID